MIFNASAIPQSPKVLSGFGDDRITVTDRMLLKDGKPWLPVMGEIHYSRIPREKWAETLQKMKEGGIEIAASYVFWIHHEEEKGKFDFTGNRDIRAFIELCHETGLEFCLRIGPWAHGECRNGGFPTGFRKNAERPYAVKRSRISPMSEDISALWRIRCVVFPSLASRLKTK